MYNVYVSACVVWCILFMYVGLLYSCDVIDGSASGKSFLTQCNVYMCCIAFVYMWCVLFVILHACITCASASVFVSVCVLFILVCMLAGAYVLMCLCSYVV